MLLWGGGGGRHEHPIKAGVLRRLQGQRRVEKLPPLLLSCFLFDSCKVDASLAHVVRCGRVRVGLGEGTSRVQRNIRGIRHAARVGYTAKIQYKNGLKIMGT